MIPIECTFTYVNMYEGGKNFDKAQLIMLAQERHIKTYLKEQKKLFDQFMSLSLEELEDIFKFNKQ